MGILSRVGVFLATKCSTRASINLSGFSCFSPLNVGIERLLLNEGKMFVISVESSAVTLAIPLEKNLVERESLLSLDMLLILRVFNNYQKLVDDIIQQELR